MEFEEFLENLEYTNACMLGKYRLTIDKQLIFPDNTFLQFSSWQDCLSYPISDHQSVADFIENLTEYNTEMIYDIDHMDCINRNSLYLDITYYGHSCFKVEKDKESIVFDPYKAGSVPGLTLPEDLVANEILCSHAHDDHAGIEEIRCLPETIQYKVKKLDVPHDDQDGKLRGRNTIHIVTFQGFKIVHMGDIGRPLTQMEVLQVSRPDVLMIPVGGFYTISSKVAFQIIDQLKPQTAILMHYKTVTSGYDVLEDIQDIVKDHPEVHACGSRVHLQKDEALGIIFMEV